MFGFPLQNIKQLICAVFLLLSMPLVDVLFSPSAGTWVRCAFLVLGQLPFSMTDTSLLQVRIPYIASFRLHGPVIALPAAGAVFVLLIHFPPCRSPPCPIFDAFVRSSVRAKICCFLPDV